MAKLQVHPCAKLFPQMSGDEYAALKIDLECYGQREPITLHDGKILDGRNRYKACLELGREPKTRNLPNGASPAAYVVSMNLHRRHLTASQKSMVAVELESLFAKENKERQREHGGTAPGRAKPNTGGNNSTSVPEPRKTRQQAAELVGINPHYVTDAKAIKTSSPELANQVASGELTLPQAKRQAQQATPTKKPKRKPRPRFDESGYLGPCDNLRSWIGLRFDRAGGAQARDECDRIIRQLQRRIEQWQKEKPI